MRSPETIRDMAGLQPTTSRCADPSKALRAQPTAPRHAALAPSGNFIRLPIPSHARERRCKLSVPMGWRSQ